ncbi:MAG TPA: PAS sensor protein, partial [Deltaproteobacteria bacterium]|nr:PAS sensor protein [Deltaproteobacteria bacterium]
NGIIGIINLNRNANDRTFKENHLKLLSTMANEAASVIENANWYRDIHEGYLSIIQVLASIIEMRDPYTASHQKRVADLAHALAIEMGLSKGEIDGVHMAASIHDIGKISVPTETLSKPSRLTENEFNIIKEHPQVACDILKWIEFPWPVVQIVLQHHERSDGSGYPQKLSAEEIVLEARVLGVADVVEAMASHRPYRPALGIDKALEEISKNRGVLYDTRVVDACLKLFHEKGFKFKE